MNPKAVVKVDENGSNKKVYFGDDGSVVEKPAVKPKAKKVQEEEAEGETFEGTGGEFVKKPKKNFKKQYQSGENLETKWYQVYEEHNTNEFKDIKDSELTILQQLCRSSFNSEILKLSKSKSS